MADSTPVLDSRPPPSMAKSPTGFHHGIPSSASRDAALHVVAARYKLHGMTRKPHALKLIHNVYGQKQAGHVWNKFMDKGMRDIGFTPSKLDPCLYYRGPILFLVYINDCILFRPDTQAIDQMVTELHSCSQQFTVNDQGDVGQKNPVLNPAPSPAHYRKGHQS